MVSFSPLRTVRATPKDINQITELLVGEFGYVFEYIFSSSDQVLIRRVIRKLLKSGGGLGTFGYMRFYMLRHGEKDVGFIRVDTSHGFWIYELIHLPFAHFENNF